MSKPFRHSIYDLAPVASFKLALPYRQYEPAEVN
jgi:hypothetical protein